VQLASLVQQSGRTRISAFFDRELRASSPSHVYTLPDSGFPDDVVVATKPFAGSVVNRDDVVKLRSSCSGFGCSESNNNMRLGCGFLTLIVIALFCAIVGHAVNSSVSPVQLFVTLTAAPAASVSVIWLIWAVMYTHETF